MPADQLTDLACDDVDAGAGLRAYAIPMPRDPDAMDVAAGTARGLGFDSLLILAGGNADPALESEGEGRLRAMVRAAHDHRLHVQAAISLHAVWSTHALPARLAPHAFSTPPARPESVVDPRAPVARTEAVLRVRRPDDPALVAWWRTALARLLELGVSGFVTLDPDRAGESLAGSLQQSGISLRACRTYQPGATLDGGAYLLPDAAATRAALAHIALRAAGWAVAAGACADSAAIRGVNAVLCQVGGGRRRSVRTWTGRGAALAISTSDVDDGAILLAENRADTPCIWPPPDLPALPWQKFVAIPGFPAPGEAIPGGATALLLARALPPVARGAAVPASDAADPLRRVVVADVSPSVDGGAYAVKCTVGARLEVRADIFADGHEHLAACVLTRAADQMDWTRHAMRALPNDVWEAQIRFTRLGRHEMRVEAWLDVWGGFVRDLIKKRDAGLDLGLEIREARALIIAAHTRAAPDDAAVLHAALRVLDGAAPQDAVASLITKTLAEAMEASDDRRFRAASFIQPIEVEREAARFSSWYEMFPRSQTSDRTQHGTFRNVIARLPHIAAMGFDTLYFPPIHPIGARNRKGRNNTLTPDAHDVGSPYAIGSQLGDHRSVHPELGTLEDFRALVAAARASGIEIALDFAIQCAPDHPWLTEHPGWFAWRPDGSMKYAENPPKKYQDIVNVDFYGPDAVPDLWHALRDVVLFWAEQGVRTFRVDNPHTKPLPFWHWMIADVRGRCPDVIFLAEAFTRPKPMAHLAKVGFSQSYTYFTWRDDKAGLIAYMTELTQSGLRDFFRPHFFVNTPDINPLFLQSSGRAGFLIRAALAATLSGLWGMYAGFELCESAALPGREEYLDSEKYELRPRPDRAPGDIVDEITQLNWLRRAEPALQSHLGVTFHTAYNDNIIYYSKQAAGEAGLILVAVSLDPHHAQAADFEVPLWLLGLSDRESVAVHDLLAGATFRWTGKMQRVTLTPDQPYAIWRIAAGDEA
jgi:starch synthase (maltosyl-transferring)